MTVTRPPAEGTAEARHSTRSGVAGLLGAACNGLFGFLLVVVITRGYGTAGAGAFFAAVGVVTMTAALCTLGAETGLIWALPRRRGGNEETSPGCCRWPSSRRWPWPPPSGPPGSSSPTRWRRACWTTPAPTARPCSR